MTLQMTADIAAEVRVILARKQIKQSAVAEVMNLSPMATSRRLRGEVSFTAEEIFTLAAFLDVDVAALHPQARTALAEGGDAA